MNKEINKKKIFILIFVILLLVLSIVMIFLYQKNSNVRHFLDEYIFRKNITENTLPSISLNNPYIYVFNDNIIILENNTLNFYNKSGNQIESLEINISNPIFMAKGNFLCVAEKNGSTFYLINSKNIVYQKTIQGKISDICVNKNGYIAISISDTSYKTLCKVFSNAGNELFTKYLSQSYIIDFSISDDNKYLALSESDFSGVSINSTIKVISIEDAISNSANSMYYNYTAPAGNFAININYSDNNLCCLYDNHIDVIKDNSVNKITDFGNSNVLFADINNDIIQIIKNSQGLLSSNFELQIINPKNIETKTYTLEKEPKSLYVSDNVIAINLGSEVIFINNNAWLIKHYTATQEVSSIVLSDDVAGIIFKDKIEILSL